MTIEKYEIKNRWTGDVVATAEISITPEMPPSVKLSLAVKWSAKMNADLSGANLHGADLRGADLRGANLHGADLHGADLSGANLHGADLRGADLHRADLRGANLHGADLHGADLSGADLHGADLRGADLRGANLRGANLSGAYMRSFKADLWLILSMARAEVPAMADALRDGRVEGSTYDGKCACLVGTLERAGATGLLRDANSPAEQWFSMICEGDKPGDDSAGGFAAKQALEWIEEYCAATGIVLA